MHWISIESIESINEPCWKGSLVREQGLSHYQVPTSCPYQSPFSPLQLATKQLTSWSCTSTARWKWPSLGWPTSPCWSSSGSWRGRCSSSALDGEHRHFCCHRRTAIERPKLEGWRVAILQSDVWSLPLCIYDPVISFYGSFDREAILL